MKEFLIELESERLGYGKVELSNPGNIGIVEGVTAIVGRNGSGKTTLGTILEKGRYAYGNRLRFSNPGMRVRMLAFSDIHSLSGLEAQYFAQRMESTMNEMVPTVAQILGGKTASKRWTELANSFGLLDVEDKRVNYLSSGELRKLIVINAMLDNPDCLILDNPYIGLDAASRDELDSMLLNMKAEGVAVVLLVCDPGDIPGFADSVIFIDDRRIISMSSPGDFLSSLHTSGQDLLPNDVPPFPSSRRQLSSYSIAFEIRKGHIRYGDRQILKDLDWRVAKGEKWALTGPNGSGKSLLLSMVCADNPQGYANDITLFDRKRGSGESIWEIKDHIGYVSPEMQLFFKSASSITEIIIQGLRNPLNMYGKPSAEEYSQAAGWMGLLGISHLSDRKFQELSAGEQRLALVARAMVKQPELLVLDEPLHGLDNENKKKVKQIIETLVERNGTTLIFVSHYTSEIPACVDNVKELVKFNVS